MPDGTLMLDRSYFGGAEWLDQTKAGFSRGAAWLDLLALCNQRPTDIFVRGIRRELGRCQLGWSKKGLANRWGWSQGKVSSILASWEQTDRIKVESDNETTIITVINYDHYQTGLLRMATESASIPSENEDQIESIPGADREQNDAINIEGKYPPPKEQIESRSRADREQTETEKGEGRREVLYQGEKGEGRREEAPRIVNLESAMAWLRGSGEVGFTIDQIREQFLYYDATRDPGTGQWRRALASGAYALISDWRSELMRALSRFAVVGGVGNEKNGSAAREVSASVAAIEKQKRETVLRAELRELTAELDALHQAGAEIEPEKKARERQLRKELEGAA